MYTQLKSTTRSLLDFIEIGREEFERSKNTGREGDFFTEVKPFADQVKLCCDEWIELAIQWIRKEKPLYMNEKQVQTTYEHLEKMSIQAFYSSTSRKNFLSSLQSAQYVLHSIVNQLEDPFNN
jgi:hypothetical protein